MQVVVHSQLMLDCMGAFSPIAAQSRKGVKPDSVVLMVGSCAEGLPPCTHADLLYSFTPIDKYLSANPDALVHLALMLETVAILHHYCCCCCGADLPYSFTPIDRSHLCICHDFEPL